MPLRAISELVVIDAGVGMAAALISHHLRESGARVIRIEPPGGDPFFDVYPAYTVWRRGQEVAAREELEALATQADICIVGGEDFPGLPAPVDPARLRTVNSKLVILDLQGFIGAGPPVPAVDLLIQARTGLCHEQFSDRPIAWAFPAPTYGAAILGLVSIFAALLERARSGRGAIATTSLSRGVLLWWASDWSSAANPDPAFANFIPKDVRQLIFRCRDGGYIHMVLGIAGAVAKAYAAFGIDQEVDPAERGLPNPANGPQNYFFRDTQLLARHAAMLDRDIVLERLWAQGIAAEAVQRPGEIWDDEQTAACGVIRTDERGWTYVGSPLSVTAVEAEAPPPAAASPARPRIIDVGNFLAGPYASRMFADLGADVIKVEPPGGDPNRAMWRSFASGSRGKRSIGIDAKSPEGLAIIHKLCATADAVHHNFRPGVAKRLGLDPAALRRLNPDVVTLQSSAYGSVGPKAQNSGFDMIMQAACGMEAQAVGEGAEPMWYRSPLVDYTTGAFGAVGLLMGLLEQARFGCAVEAEISLLGSGLAMLAEVVRSPDGRFLGAASMDREQTGFHPAERLYRTADGWLAVVARNDAQATALSKSLGLGDGFGARKAWGRNEAERLAEALVQISTDEALTRLRAAGVWAEACVEDGWAATRADPVLRELEVVGRRPQGALGDVEFIYRLIDPLWGPGSAQAPASPLLAEHTTEIMGELGYSPDEIARLLSAGVIFASTAPPNAPAS